MQEGEKPAQTLANVDLGYVPLFRATLSSPLTPEEICNQIAARVVHRGKLGGNLAFTGSTWLGAFEVRVRMPTGRGDGPVLLGTVEETPGGSHLSIRLRPHHFATLGIVVWTLGVAFAVSVEESPLLGVLMFGLGLLDGARFWWKFQREGRQLLKLVEEECCVTLLPRVEPPTTF